jgi:hypothetical protein
VITIDKWIPGNVAPQEGLYHYCGAYYNPDEKRWYICFALSYHKGIWSSVDGTVAAPDFYTELTVSNMPKKEWLNGK